MKRKLLIKRITKGGCYLKRHGSKHDIYANPSNGRQTPIPRHREIGETLAKLIEKQLGLE